VRILEIGGVKQTFHELFCTYVSAPTFLKALKVFGQKK
jgi:hypothetical protein